MKLNKGDIKPFLTFVLEKMKGQENLDEDKAKYCLKEHTSLEVPSIDQMAEKYKKEGYTEVWAIDNVPIGFGISQEGELVCSSHFRDMYGFWPEPLVKEYFETHPASAV